MIHSYLMYVDLTMAILVWHFVNKFTFQLNSLLCICERTYADVK